MIRALPTHSWSRIALGLLGLGAIAVCGVVLFAWSGLYSVAASRGHWAMTDFALRFGMTNSVETHAPDIEPPPLDDPDLVRLGAAHFHGGCAYCHGSPGTPISPISAAMLPPPPDLSDRVGEWNDQELFWIVKHGIKYAGMPAWVAQERDDEVWAVVAFLRRLPGLDRAAYRELAMGDLNIEPQSGRELATAESTSDAVSTCGRCHGVEDRPPLSRLVPRLHGQSAAMLRQALEAYAAGNRFSGIMQPAAAGLSARAIESLSNYYAGLPPPRDPSRAPQPQALIEAGRQLAMQGAPGAGVPACLGCHHAEALPVYPRLAGQHAAYMANQLRAWQRGEKGRTGQNAIMAPIARRLNEQQIVSLAAFFASLPADAPAGAAAATDAITL